MSQTKTYTIKAVRVVGGVPFCKCAKAAHRAVSRTDANPDRPFWTCAKERNDTSRCRFWEWEDQIEGLGDDAESEEPQSPRKAGSSSSQREQRETPSTPRSRPKESAEESPAKLARRNMIAEAKADAHGDDTPAKQTLPATDRTSSSSSSAFKPKKEKKITPSQEVVEEVVEYRDEAGDGMDLDRESDIEDPGSIVRMNADPERGPGPSAAGRKPVDRLDDMQEAQANNEGSPKKKNRSPKAQDKQKGKAIESVREEEVVVQVASPKPKKREVTSSSQASSSTQVETDVPATSNRSSRVFSADPEITEESTLATLNKLSKQLKSWARKVAIAEEVAELKQKKIDEMEDEEQKLRSENSRLISKNLRLEDKVQELKEQVRNLQAKVNSLEFGGDTESE